MTDNFEQILDLCIDRINHGESPEVCLADYPDYAGQLKPLLNTVAKTKNVYAFTPSPEAKREARKRFYSALDKQKHPSFVEWFRSRPLALGTIASVIVVLLITFFALRATVFPINVPSNIPTTTIPGSAPTGNFVFLVSDDVNAISDFSSLSVTLEKVELMQSGSPGQWIEFVPETTEFDLSQLPGDKTQELWRGDIPEGTYSKEVIYVSQVQGILKSTGETLTIKLPSNKLQMSFTFEVSPDTVTSFTYDLTVIKTGNGKNSKYILKPQADQSGSSQQPQQSNKDNTPQASQVVQDNSSATNSTKDSGTKDKGKPQK